jgi:DNA-binding GntR family transcriptional regulator
MKLREKAYERFTQHLLAKKIRPGQFVSQRELVALTGLPLGAIRELIPRLEAEGLIVTAPQRGMQVAHLDVKLVRNAFQLRAFLEVEAVRHFTRTAPDEEIDRVAEDLARVRKQAESGPVTPALLDEAQAVDWGFHDALIDSLGNELISNIYRVNSIRIRLIRLERVVLSPDVLLPALGEHAEIVGAIRARDPERAAQAMQRHMVSARNRAMGIAIASTSEPAAAVRAVAARAGRNRHRQGKS